MSSATAPPPAVEWEFSPATTRPIRLLVYVAIGLGVGPVCGLVVLVGATLVGNDGVGVALFVLVLALFVGLGVGSGRALFALGNAPPEVHETVRALSWWGVAGGVLVGGGIGLWGLRRTDVGVELLLGSVVAGFLLLSVGAGLRTRGAVDPAERTVTYGNHTVSIEAIRRVHAVTVGPFVLAVVRYHRGRVGPSTPRWFVVSPAAYDAVESVRLSLDGNGNDNDNGNGNGNYSDATGYGEEATTPRAVRWVAAAFGVGCLLSGPVLWVVLPAEGRLLAGYLGVFGLLFGTLFVRYALVA